MNGYLHIDTSTMTYVTMQYCAPRRWNLYDVKQTKNNAVVIKDQFYILIHA